MDLRKYFSTAALPPTEKIDISTVSKKAWDYWEGTNVGKITKLPVETDIEEKAEELMTLSEVAGYFGTYYDNVEMWVDEGKLTSFTGKKGKVFCLTGEVASYEARTVLVKKKV